MKISNFSPEIKERFPAIFWHKKVGEYSDMTGVPEDNFDYMDTRTFVDFSEKEWEKFQHIVSNVNKIFLKAYNWYFQDFEKNLLDFLPYKSYFRPYFPLDEQFIARYDIMLDADGTPKFLETNANTPGMITESYLPSRFLTPDNYYNQSDNYINHTKDWWRQKKQEKNLTKIGIFTAHMYENEDYLTVETYKTILESVFGEENVIVGDIFDLNIIKHSAITLKGQKVDALLSYFPLEFFLTDGEFFRDFLNIVTTGNCFLANPIESMIFQDKLIFAVVWENFDKY